MTHLSNHEELIRAVVVTLMNEDGEQVPIACEPEREPGRYRNEHGYTFDLCAPFDDDTWARLCDAYEDIELRAMTTDD